MTDFVHLHVHSQYSLLDGAIRISSLMERAQQYGMKSVAITDHGTMFGCLDFYQQAHKAGIKPVIGCECYVAPRSIDNKTPADNRALGHLILLAENNTGYRNLCKLASVAQLQGFYYRPRVDKKLLRAHSEGLIAMTACLHGEVPRRIVERRMDAADEAALEYQQIFGEGNFFLEVQNNGIGTQERVNEALLDMSQRLSIPLVATNDCHYLDREDAIAHDVLLCIQTGKTIHDKDRFKFRTEELFFKSGQEMADFFNDYPGAIANTVAIADRCEVSFDFNNYHFPHYDTGNSLSTEALFEQQVREGFENTWPRIVKNQPQAEREVYLERLNQEIATINDMGFPGYFLIVADFIQHAKDNDIPVGPGRGSAAGSLVAYSLGITDLDPIAYGLIFERFLNPARKSMPDIDVDFCINGREDVFKYVVDRYGGGDYVAQIITYGKLKTRAVIRDVGRALDIPLRDVDIIAKLVPDVLNISLDEALAKEPRLTKMAAEREDVGELIKICRVLEGQPRHASTHAAGVVIADKPLVDYLPLYRGKNGEVVTQFDMKGVEKIGLVKFDFLGLRNLTVIDETLRLIAEQGKTVPQMDALDLNDAETYRLLSMGDTTGVFQLESAGMKNLLVRLRPETFDDVIALVALYRPGPLDSGMVDDFVERKHGRKEVTYLLPQLEPILEATYGVIVYQEQVMRIASVLANYKMAEADDLRKAMGKKIPEILAAHRARFLEGAVDSGVPEDGARSIFDLIEKFGGYGFNKSHSAAYALIAYQTAFLKAHYTVELLAALLTSEMASSDGVAKYIAECRSHGIDINPPDINKSAKTFTVEDGRIRFGLLAVKNVGSAAIDAVIEAREKDGPFASLFDFCERVEFARVNKRVVESLIKCGAFDSLGEYRSRMMAVLEDAVDHGSRVQRERNDPQMGLFDTLEMSPTVKNYPQIPDIAKWGLRELLAHEKDALGFYISGHPLDRFTDLLAKYTNASVLTLGDRHDGDIVRVGGIVSAARTISSRTGPMAFITLEDLHGVVEVTVFARLFAIVQDLLQVDRAILIQGEIQKDDTAVKILANAIVAAEEAENQWTATVHLNLDLERTDHRMLEQLQTLMGGHRGTCQAFLNLKQANGSVTVVELGDAYRLAAGPKLAADVTGLLGYPAVETRCSGVEPMVRSRRRKFYKK